MAEETPQDWVRFSSAGGGLAGGGLVGGVAMAELIGLVGELIAAQRRVSEEVLVELRRRSFEAGDD